MKVNAAALVLEQAPFIWRVLTHLGVPQQRLEDACQEVFLVVLGNADGYEERSSLKTWLYGICRNIAHVERRRSRVQTEIPTEDLPESIVQPAQEGEVWIKQAHARLIQALSHLDEEQREIFVLFEIEELSMEDIAEALQVPLRTCYSRLGSARQKIHAELRRRELPNKVRVEALL
jgi:RNA polymerase sigma-70 factor (ECF subfamily)